MIRHKIKYKISFFFFLPLLGHFLGNQTREKELARKEKKRKNTGEVDGEVAWIWHRLQDEKKGKIEI
jgi:hypothetical protein